MPALRSNLHLGATGVEVKDLQAKLLQVGLALPTIEQDGTFGVGTIAAIKEFQIHYGLEPTGMVDDDTAAVLEMAAAVAATGKGRVEGRLLFNDGSPAGGLSLKLHRCGFGNSTTELAQTKADARGFYAFTYDRGPAPPVLEVRLDDPTGTPISKPRYDALSYEVMNLVVPSLDRDQTSEFRRLATATAAFLNRASIGAAQEIGERRDISFLHNATGWDARLLAMAATAERLAKATKISAEAVYGLLRAGLPSDQEALATIGRESATAALTRAIEARIVILDNAQKKADLEAYTQFSRRIRLARVARGGLSSVSEVIRAAGLDEAETQRFVDAASTTADGALWDRAARARIPPNKINALRLQGRLAVLTTRNVAVATAAAKAAKVKGPDELTQLVDSGFYRAETWLKLLRETAGGSENALDKLVPPAFEGKNPSERAEAYAIDLAAKVRGTYPTAVLAHVVASKDLALGTERDDVRNAVVRALNNAHILGFDITRKPLTELIAGNSAKLFEGIDHTFEEPVVERLATLQRLINVSPSIEAATRLASLGLNSAASIASLTQRQFLHYYVNNPALLAEGRLIWRRARQVSATTLNVFTGIQSVTPGAATGSVIGIAAPPPASGERPGNDVIRRYPTLEELFGSLDYCSCEHCRSVLSPAAYYVDILRLLDRPDAEWNLFLSYWNSTRGESYTARYRKPIDALTARRPDLTRLQLTCENTNTALPYIDVVNEILELAVAPPPAGGAAVTYNTATAANDDLMSEPSNLRIEAYEHLKAARYPLALPFDLSLETVRAFLNHLGVPRASFLEIMRRNDDAADLSAAGYTTAGGRSILVEQLGLSGAEDAILTGSSPLTRWRDLYGGIGTNNTDAVNLLKNARTLARRLDISYRDLAALVMTHWVNPDLDPVVMLRKMGIEVATLFAYKGAAGTTPLSQEERDAVRATLDAFSSRHAPLLPGFNAADWVDQAWASGAFDRSLYLKAPAADCAFDQVELLRRDGSAPQPMDFVRLAFLVRLQKRLGWSIEELDRALRVVVPRSLAGLAASELGPALRAALPAMAQIDQLVGKLDLGPDARLKLLSICAPLDTGGPNPLYARLFLTPSVSKIDSLFDHPLGRYLQHFNSTTSTFEPFTWPAGSTADDHVAGRVGLVNHLVGVQAALALSAADIATILDSEGRSIATAPLDLATMTTLYRFALLARGLGMSIADVARLRALTGLDPFAAAAPPPPPAPIDMPLARTLRFVVLAQRLKSAGIAIGELAYWFNHRLEAAIPPGPGEAQAAALVAALSAQARQIEAEHAPPSEPAAISDEMVRQGLGLLLPAHAADVIFGMWNGTQIFEAQRVVPSGANPIDPAAIAVESSLSVNFAAASRIERLSFRGVLTDTERTRLNNANLAVPLPGLLADIGAQARRLFDTYLGQIFDATDFELLFLPASAMLSEAERRDRDRQRRQRFVGHVLPALRRRLLRDRAIDEVTTATEAERATVELVARRSMPIAGANTTLVDELLGNGTNGTPSLEGASVTFYGTADLTGAALQPPSTVQTIDTTQRPAGTQSARFEGFFQVPDSGTYRFEVSLERVGARAVLALSAVSDPILRLTAGAVNAAASVALQLPAGVLHRFALEVTNLQDGEATLSILGDQMPRATLGASIALLPTATVDRARRAMVLLHKTLRIMRGFNLDTVELAHILANSADVSLVDIGSLPTTADTPPSAPSSVLAFLEAFLDLRDVRAASGSSEGLVHLFQLARRRLVGVANANSAVNQHSADLAVVVGELTHHEPSTILEALEHLRLQPTASAAPAGEAGFDVVAEAFVRPRLFARLLQVADLARHLRVPVRTIARWAAPEANANIAAEVRASVKALYPVETWRTVAKPIFDRLRRSKRDGLVAFLLNSLGFERREQLFEYFLLDPDMEPVVHTSRIRLAISAVQTFIQRCLMNQETTVPPAALDTAKWRWMYRYRLWEANRKIFLYPENWLEPEFRDDKSHVFAELEASLLQGDVSDDAVEAAFRAYLKGLDKIAKMDVMAVYAETNPNDPAATRVHVVARTQNKPHKYFYRRVENRLWTMWEPLSVDIDGDHVAMAMWRRRLFLFWVTFLEKPVTGPPTGQSNKSFEQFGRRKLGRTHNDARKQVVAQLSMSEYLQGQWSAAESTGFSDPDPPKVGLDFDPRNIVIDLSKDIGADGRDLRIIIRLMSGEYGREFQIVSRHAPPRVRFPVDSIGGPVQQAHDPIQFIAGAAVGSKIVGNGRLTVSFPGTSGPWGTGEAVAPTTILGQTTGFFDQASIVISNDPFAGADGDGMLAAPFFFQTEQSAFFVEPTLQRITFEEAESDVFDILAPRNVDDVWALLAGQDVRSYYPVPMLDLGQPLPVLQIAAEARFHLSQKGDWLLDAPIGLSFDDRVVLPSGSVDIGGLGVSNADASMPGRAVKPATLRHGDGVVAVMGTAGLTPRLKSAADFARKYRLSQPAIDRGLEIDDRQRP